MRSKGTAKVGDAESAWAKEKAATPLSATAFLQG